MIIPFGLQLVALAVILLFLILLLWFRNIFSFGIVFVSIFVLIVSMVGVKQLLLLLQILVLFPGRTCIIIPLGEQRHLVLRF